MEQIAYRKIGEVLSTAEMVTRVSDVLLHSAIDGMLRDSTLVIRVMKAGEVDSRGN